MKPNLFIVGAPKCGTTAWASYLASHPQIFFSKMKEPHHFALDFPPDARIVDRDEYLELFAKSGPAKIVAEASPTYLYSTEAAKAIRAFNPDARIIILLRKQAEYLPSRHNQLVLNGLENIKDFAKAWRMSGKRDRSNMPAFCKLPRVLDYREAGRFSEQVERYLGEFPRDQIRLFHFSEWTVDPRATYLEIMQFLGLEDDGRVDFPKVNEARHQRSALVVQLVRHPPLFVAWVVNLVKKLTGRSRLGLANAVVELNAAKGSISRIDEPLKEEIRAYFEADNARLRALLGTTDETAHARNRS